MLNVDIEKRLDRFTLKVKLNTDNGITGIFGASGSGKSVTLKCIAGIMKPDKGIIELDGRVLYDSSRRINLKPQQRKVGYLFQSYALFPDMTVKSNIIAGLSHLERSKRHKRADELMERFRISHLADKRPAILSGGEQQRAALARLIASEPDLLLLDEPFSSLDTMLKCALIPMLRDTVSDYGKTCIPVSHDVGEVAALCSDVTMLTDGVNSPSVGVEEFINNINKSYSDSGLLRVVYNGGVYDR